MDGGFSLIEDNPADPITLFTSWFNEVKGSGHLMPEALCLATQSKENGANARTLLLRRIEKDGILIITDKGSLKHKEIKENPHASVVFLWVYMKDGVKLARQVRMNGLVEEVSPDQFLQVYNAEPVYCKIRAHICTSGRVVDWDKQTQLYEKLIKEYNQGENNLEMPENIVGYKLTPKLMDFYHAVDGKIGDRFLYKRGEEEWTSERVSA